MSLFDVRSAEGISGLKYCIRVFVEVEASVVLRIHHRLRVFAKTNQYAP